MQRRKRVSPYFRWFDLWVGVYVDVPDRQVYIGYIPMCGIRFDLS